MVNVVAFGDGIRKSHKFDMDKTVGEVLDEVVTDPDERSVSFIIFMGKTLLEATKLQDVPKMKDKYTLCVMQRTEKKLDPVSFDYGKFRECRRMLKKLNNSRKFIDLMTTSLHDNGFCLAICSKFPVLKKDWVAYRLFTDSSIWNIFLRPSSECKGFFEEHPVLVEVYYHILNSFLQRVNANANGLVTSESSSTLNTSDAEEYSSSSSQEPSSSRRLITSDMLRQAMAGALASVNSSSNVSNALETNTNPYAAQLRELENLGFMDVEQNTNALEATSGDVGQAIELLIVMRESMEN